MEKQLIMGKGRWATKIGDILKNSFNIETDRVTRDYKDLDLNVYENIYIIISPQNNIEVLDYCLKNSKANIYIEKPLSLTTKNIPDLLRTYKNRVFVGNKFIYSPSIKNLKSILQNEEVTGIFTKWIKSVPCLSAGIFFDILYHHLIILEYVFDDKVQIYNKRYFTSNTSGMILGKIRNVPFIMEGSGNNLFKLFNNSIRIETIKNTYVIEEKNNVVSLSSINGEVTDNYQTVYYCLEEFLNGSFRNVEDFDIIKQLEE